MMIIELIGGVFWVTIGAMMCWVFANLIWGAIRDPELRKQFLKTSNGRTKHSLPVTCMLWFMMAVLYAFLVYLTWLGALMIVDAFS